MKKHLLLIVLLSAARSLSAQTILGIDVYAGQGTINWPQVYAAGKSFAFVKATKGTCYTDSKFVTNMVNGNAAGVKVGAYHFSLPEDNTATAEAQYFLSAAGAYIGPGYLPPVLDLEDPAGTCITGTTPLCTYFTTTQLATWVQAWCDYVYNQTGVAPIVYIDRYHASSCLASGIINTGRYKLWIAQWDNCATCAPTTTGIWPTWLFKQYYDQGTVSGASGAVDLDVFNGTATDFNNLLADTIPLACGNDFSCGPPAPLALNINSSCVTTSCSTVGATPPSQNISFYGGSNCTTLYQSGRYDDDVWFSISPANSNPVTITVTPTSGNLDAVVGVYHGSCSSPTQDACADVNGANGSEQLTFTPGAGTSYLVRVFGYDIGSNSGSFDICVTGTASCTAPSVTTSVTNANCGANGAATANASGGTAPYSYLWSTGATTATITALAAGTYTVTVTSAGGCSATASAIVSGTGSIAVTTSVTNANCGANGAATANASGGTTPYTYLWSTGATTATLTALAAGTYTVTVTSAGGCSATATAIVSNTGTSLTVNAGNDQTNNGAGVTIGGNPTAGGGTVPYTYVWSPATGLSSSAIANPTANPTSSTTYNLTVTDVNGCSGTDNVLVTVPTPSCDTSIHPAITVNFCDLSVPPYNGASYQWQRNALDINGASTRFHTVSVTGTYTCKVTFNGCPDNYSNDRYMQYPNCSATGIEDLAPYNIQITPNPSTGMFKISLDLDKTEQIQISVFDAAGKLSKEEVPAMVSGNYSYEINLGHVAKGVYILQLKIGDKVLSRSIEIL